MTDHPRPKLIAPSLVLVDTGDGKGKSTPACGALMAALARSPGVAADAVAVDALTAALGA
jgi:ATP:corrinoid adenosyltransferase